MTLVVETPETRATERDYILSVLLGDFLGLPWRRVTSERRDGRITLDDQSGEIRLPDILFSIPDADWLSSASMPQRPLPQWNTLDLTDDITLVEPVVPVIYGDREPRCRRDENTISLSVDIFGSAFFMLSRYEELVTSDRDEHDRFPAWASLAFKETFLERPIVDEYVEVLWAAMRKLWPQLERRRREARIRITHDVDRPGRYAFGSFRRFLRSMAGDILKRGDFGALVRGPRARFGTGGRLHSADPYNTFDWLMDVSEKQGTTSAFYFIPGKTYAPHDPPYDLDDPRIRDLIRRIHARGHEIGLHPGYRTYRDPAAITAQAERLRVVCAEEGVTQDVWGGRMHYLQWAMNVTPSAWEQAGMAYDSTLGYADHAGFRCGTSQDYPVFDLKQRRTLGLIERPLIAMEGTLWSRKYMEMDCTEQIEEYLAVLRSRCHQFGGCFNLLWHNSELFSSAHRAVYRQAIA